MLNRISLCLCGLLLLSYFRVIGGNCRERSPGKYPYFFGRTNVDCIGRMKRNYAPQRFSFKEPEHVWIVYKGYYFEYGVGISRAVHVSRTLYGNGKCTNQIESRPAGYSRLSVHCLKTCARNFAKRFGPYRPMYTIVHPFVNMMSRILCWSHCPPWCQTYH
ncbi:uncharacterized protein LOC125655677 [Ostrea edulis]|uniref:uncharacterized protein LOC125655677 n=1 Tax=Ostrea edulis TaxID=37623 RepID=UPI0020941107|nr:uncharacterized protein LOC125655677 [Ostrea edulis]